VPSCDRRPVDWAVGPQIGSGLKPARLVTVAWPGASSRAPGSHSGRRACHRQFCRPRRKVGIGGGASWRLGGSASFRNGSDRWSGTTGPFPSRGGDLVLLAGCQPAKGPTEQRDQLNTGDSPVGPEPSVTGVARVTWMRARRQGRR
jgi:hypothetical protein